MHVVVHGSCVESDGDRSVLDKRHAHGGLVLSAHSDELESSDGGHVLGLDLVVEEVLVA